ncbi:MAG: hypothetical protein Sapg2KO_01420 [Saprospiraceae bacterium]
MFRIKNIFILTLVIGLTACTNSAFNKDYENLPSNGTSGINAVIEIPAGSNQKIEYQKATKRFQSDLENGQARLISFLPYPGNYGFIPSTYMDPAQGGDGDALDILVLCESLETGTVVETKPIATLLLRDAGELDTKIIAVPTDPALQVFQIEDFQDFLIHQDAARRIIETWFLNYNPKDDTQLIRWEDDQYALQEIKKWNKKN